MSTEIEEHYLEKLDDKDSKSLETNQMIFKQLKEHAVDLVVRCTSKKRKYMNFIWD